METYFVEYLLGALDERTRLEVDAYLAENPEAREKLASLKQALAPLEADKEDPVPPLLLVERTLARVAEQICAPKSPVSTPLQIPAETALPKAPPVSPLAATSGRSWWRRIDVLVAACLLATIAGIGLMVLAKMRGPSSAALVAECKNNLRQFYIALQNYRDQHGQFPDVAKETPYNVAGVVVPMLNENGTLPASASIRCPGVGSPVSCQFTLTALKAMNDADFEQRAPTLSWCYAYSLGYRGANGEYHGPTPAQASLSQTPLMADRAPPEGIANNSINHGGAGQNVLFADGHAVFLTGRVFGGIDDIFANNAGKVAAGLNPRDIVLGHSAARP